jgi:hypothetical protein
VARRRLAQEEAPREREGWPAWRIPGGPLGRCRLGSGLGSPCLRWPVLASILVGAPAAAQTGPDLSVTIVADRSTANAGRVVTVSNFGDVTCCWREPFVGCSDNLQCGPVSASVPESLAAGASVTVSMSATVNPCGLSITRRPQCRHTSRRLIRSRGTTRRGNHSAPEVPHVTLRRRNAGGPRLVDRRRVGRRTAPATPPCDADAGLGAFNQILELPRSPCETRRGVGDDGLLRPLGEVRAGPWAAALPKREATSTRRSLADPQTGCDH